MKKQFEQILTDLVNELDLDWWDVAEDHWDKVEDRVVAELGVMALESDEFDEWMNEMFDDI